VSAKVCLRCEWSGETAEDACPRCAAALFSAARRPAETADPSDRPAVAAATEHRHWGARVGVAAVAALAVAAFVFVQLHPGPATGADTSAGRDGYLLVPTGGRDGARLWVWDLATGTAEPGPVLGAMPEELVVSVTLQDTWIGLTTPTRSGGRTASVLRHLGPTDRPIVVARGGFVAWSAAGGYVSTARTRPLAGCRVDLEVRTWFVTIRQEERRFSGPVCGDLVAFGRDRLVPYVALWDRGRLRIAQVGHGSLDTRLRGRTIASVSGDGDLLVEGPVGPLELWSQPSAPVRVGAGRTGLVAEDVLAWSPDAGQAYVLGSERGLHGVFRLIVGPELHPQRLDLVTATSAVNVGATTASDGDLYLATDGVIRRWHDGALTDVPVPPGAPAPEGPILWVSALPYSSTEG
jgi:hypothetical protein